MQFRITQETNQGESVRAFLGAGGVSLRWKTQCECGLQSMTWRHRLNKKKQSKQNTRWGPYLLLLPDYSSGAQQLLRLLPCFPTLNGVDSQTASQLVKYLVGASRKVTSWWTCIPMYYPFINQRSCVPFTYLHILQLLKQTRLEIFQRWTHTYFLVLDIIVYKDILIHGWVLDV